MAIENFLIVLKKNVSSQATDYIVSIIKNFGGRIEIIAGQGKAIIATFDNCFADKIRKFPYVKLIGGVTMRKRRLVRKRVH